MKGLVIGILSFLITSIAQAQIYYQGGYNLGMVSSDLLENTSSLSSYHFGVGNWFPLKHQKMAIIGEMNLSNKGYIQKFPDREIDTRMTYASLLTALSYEAFYFLTLEAGLESSLLLDVRVDNSGTSFGGAGTVKKGDVSGMVGLHFLDGHSLSLYIRYYHGFLNQMKTNRIGQFGDFQPVTDLRTRLFQVGIRLTLFEQPGDN